MIPHQTGSQSVSLFCVAAPADVAELRQWEIHLLPLQQKGLLTFWSNHQLRAGTERMVELSRYLNQADAVVFLLSADFFADDDCVDLMHKALLRQQKDFIKLFPLLVRSVTWQDSPLGTFTCLPANSVPIMTWEHPDEGWLSAVQGVRRLLGRALPNSWQLPSLDKRAATDRERMLRRLHRTYQSSLEGSLQGVAWMELGLVEHPDAVQNAVHLLQRLPDRTKRLLPAGYSMLSVYEQAEEELLILGAPGSGKSTLLLALALELVARAQANPTHPLPIIVPLSSWAVNKPPLTDWLVEQLLRIYDVPSKLGRLWMEQGQVLPLLDGLDEMEEAARQQCIVAINTYHTERLAPLVVCSRHTEYDQASIRQRLFLQDAVVVQPLTQEQVADILLRGGMELIALREAFSRHPLVRDLATTPLMLSILMITYRGMVVDDLPRQEAALEEKIWTDYVKRMVRQKGADRKTSEERTEKLYSLEQTCSWLVFLAQQMQRGPQTIFFAEYLNAQWLTASQQRTLTFLTRRIPVLVIGACVGLLVTTVITPHASNTLLLQMSVLGVFVGGYLDSSRAAETAERGRLSGVRTFRHLRNAVLLGVLLAASCGLSLHPPDPRTSDAGYFLSDWLRDACIFGVGGLLSGWVFQVSVDHEAGRQAPLLAGSRPSRFVTWMNMIRSLPHRQAAVLLGIGIAISYGLHNGLLYGPGMGLTGALISGLATGLLYIGPDVVLSVVLVDFVLATSLQKLRFAERIHWRWRALFQRDHLRATVSVAAMTFLLFGLIFGLFGLMLRLNEGLLAGLIEGLSDGLGYGLGYGLGFGLTYWLLLGLYHGIQQEHLNDQDRIQFNQGIQRSLRNGLLVSLISVIIIGVTSVLKVGLVDGMVSGLSYGLDVGLVVGLRFGLNVGLGYGLKAAMEHGLNDGLSAGLSVGLHNGLIILIVGMMVIWVISGGLTVLRHYVIRWLLARRQYFPFRAQAFLDDATRRILLRRVGGGYSFIHHRLLDYFAALVDTSDSK